MKLYFAWLPALFCCITTTAQTIFTVAGGTGTSLGDGAPALHAALNNPYGITIDTGNNIYFADRNSHRIRKIDAAGVVTTIAGTGVAGYSGDGKKAVKARIDYPIGLALDHQGNLVFADRYNNCVRRVQLTPPGIIETIAGNGTAGFSGEGGPATGAQLNGPAGLMEDTGGDIYVCDAYNHCIRKITPDGKIMTIAGTAERKYSGDGGPATAAGLIEPYGIAADRAGNIFLTDYGSNVIRKIDAAGIITTLAGTGTAGYSGDGGPATGAALNKPTGIALDSAGNILIADSENQRIRLVTTSGVITSIAGTGATGYSGDGGPAVSAALSGPVSIAVSKAGVIYFSDLGNNRIRAIGPTDEQHDTATSISISVEPDPAAMTIRFAYRAHGIVLIKLTDLDGKVLDIKSILNSSEAIFDVSKLKSGLYMYEAILNGQRRTGKFRIE